MATGLTVGADDISVGGRVSPGAQLSRVKAYQFTESTDLTLTVRASVGDADRIGDASQTIVIPTKGLVSLAFTGRILLDAGTSAAEANMLMGIRIGSTNYWPSVDDQGVVAYITIGISGIANNSDYIENTGLGTQFGISLYAPGTWVSLDIEALSIPTGSQSVGAVVGVVTTGSILKGATTATRIYLTTTDAT